MTMTETSPRPRIEKEFFSSSRLDPNPNQRFQDAARRIGVLTRAKHTLFGASLAAGTTVTVLGAFHGFDAIPNLSTYYHAGCELYTGVSLLIFGTRGMARNPINAPR